MNTTHSTFNTINTSYTVIGGTKGSEDGSLSAIILHRGGRPYRDKLVKELVNLDINEILVVESSLINQQSFEKECLENEKLRFILFKDKVTPGEIVNIGISESKSQNLLVLWDDCYLDSKMVSYRVFEKIAADNRICTIPTFRDDKGELIPTLMTPLFNSGLLKVIPAESSESLKSLYPYQFTGIYNRDLFIKSGGYDIRLENSYWQLMDFGLRTYMWGGRIIQHPSFNLQFFPRESQIDDITPDISYRLYSLKNLSVIIRRGVGSIPLRRFFPFYDKLGFSLTESIKIFKEVRAWVRENRTRFVVDAPTVTKEWDQG